MEKLVLSLLLTLGSLSAMDDGEHCDTPYRESNPRVVRDLEEDYHKKYGVCTKTHSYTVSNVGKSPEEHFKLILQDHITKLDQERDGERYAILRFKPRNSSASSLCLYKDCKGSYFAFQSQIFQDHEELFAQSNPPIPPIPLNTSMRIQINDLDTPVYAFNDHGSILLFHKRLAYIKKNDA